jgi:hypothetical protein
MRIQLVVICVAVAVIASVPSTVFSQALVSKAEMFHKHGLLDDAKREAIGVVYSGAVKADLANAKFLLAAIAIEESRLSVAAELCGEIIQSHPETTAAQKAKDLLGQTMSLTDAGLKNAVENVVAKKYFSNAEFHLSDLDVAFTIDTSFMDKEEHAALYWLDKIIAEFPGTPSEEIARYYRIKALLGKAGTLRDGLGGSGAWGAAKKIRSRTESYEDTGFPGIFDGLEGLNLDPSIFDEINKEFPEEGLEGAMKEMRKEFIGTEVYSRFYKLQGKAELAFREFEKKFPDSNLIPKLRFMVGYSYWYLDDFSRAKPWLEEGSKVGDDGEHTFWSHLSKLRLDNWRP